MSVPDIKQALRHIEREEWDQAVHLLEQWIQEFPIYPSPYILLARLMEHQHRFVQALRLYQEARFLVPRSPIVADGIQQVLARLRQRQTLPRWETLNRSWVVRPILEKIEEPEPSQKAEITFEEPALETPSEEPSAADSSAEKTEEKSSYPSEFDILDLDTLIEQLEEARIVPKPDFSTEAPMDTQEDLVAPEVVSETLALIYEAQEQYEQAAQIYERLAIKYPERTTEFLQKAVQARLKASGQSERE